MSDRDLSSPRSGSSRRKRNKNKKKQPQQQQEQAVQDQLAGRDEAEEVAVANQQDAARPESEESKSLEHAADLPVSSSAELQSEVNPFEHQDATAGSAPPDTNAGKESEPVDSFSLDSPPARIPDKVRSPRDSFGFEGNATFEDEQREAIEEEVDEVVASEAEQQDGERGTEYIDSSVPENATADGSPIGFPLLSPAGKQPSPPQPHLFGEGDDEFGTPSTTATASNTAASDTDAPFSQTSANGGIVVQQPGSLEADFTSSPSDSATKRKRTNKVQSSLQDVVPSISGESQLLSEDTIESSTLAAANQPPPSPAVRARKPSTADQRSPKQQEQKEGKPIADASERYAPSEEVASEEDEDEVEARRLQEEAARAAARAAAKRAEKAAKKITQKQTISAGEANKGQQEGKARALPEAETARERQEAAAAAAAETERRAKKEEPERQTREETARQEAEKHANWRAAEQEAERRRKLQEEEETNRAAVAAAAAQAEIERQTAAAEEEARLEAERAKEAAAAEDNRKREEAEREEHERIRQRESEEESHRIASAAVLAHEAEAETERRAKLKKKQPKDAKPSKQQQVAEEEAASAAEADRLRIQEENESQSAGSGEYAGEAETGTNEEKEAEDAAAQKKRRKELTKNKKKQKENDATAAAPFEQDQQPQALSVESSASTRIRNKRRHSPEAEIAASSGIAAETTEESQSSSTASSAAKHSRSSSKSLSRRRSSADEPEEALTAQERQEDQMEGEQESRSNRQGSKRSIQRAQAEDSFGFESVSSLPEADEPPPRRLNPKSKKQQTREELQAAEQIEEAQPVAAAEPEEPPKRKKLKKRFSSSIRSEDEEAKQAQQQEAAESQDDGSRSPIQSPPPKQRKRREQSGEGLAAQKPEWAQLQEQIAATLLDIKEKTSSLVELHSARLRLSPEYEDGIVETESNIDSIAKEIKKTLKDVEEKLDRMKNVANGEQTNLEEARVQSEAMHNLGAELAAVSKEYRRAQRSYLRSLRELEENGENKKVSSRIPAPTPTAPAPVSAQAGVASSGATALSPRAALEAFTSAVLNLRVTETKALLSKHPDLLVSHRQIGDLLWEALRRNGNEARGLPPMIDALLKHAQETSEAHGEVNFVPHAAAGMQGAPSAGAAANGRPPLPSRKEHKSVLRKSSLEHSLDDLVHQELSTRLLVHLTASARRVAAAERASTESSQASLEALQMAVEGQQTLVNGMNKEFNAVRAERLKNEQTVALNQVRIEKLSAELRALRAEEASARAEILISKGRVLYSISSNFEENFGAEMVSLHAAELQAQIKSREVSQLVTKVEADHKLAVATKKNLRASESARAAAAKLAAETQRRLKAAEDRLAACQARVTAAPLAILLANEERNKLFTVTISLAARNLEKRMLFVKPNAFLRIYGADLAAMRAAAAEPAVVVAVPLLSPAKGPGGSLSPISPIAVWESSPVASTPVIRSNSDPVWPAISANLFALCGGSRTNYFKIEVWNCIQVDRVLGKENASSLPVNPGAELGHVPLNSTIETELLGVATAQISALESLAHKSGAASSAAPMSPASASSSEKLAAPTPPLNAQFPPYSVELQLTHPKKQGKNIGAIFVQAISIQEGGTE